MLWLGSRNKMLDNKDAPEVEEDKKEVGNVAETKDPNKYYKNNTK